MHLIFLPLLALTTANAELECSWQEVNMGTKTCHNSQRIAKTFVDLDTCMGDCAADGDCIQIFWQSPEDRGKTEPKCHRYRACAQERTQHLPGTNIVFSCSEAPMFSTADILKTALASTGCTSQIATMNEDPDTTAWEALLGTSTQKNTQQVFSEMYETCYNAQRGTATAAEEDQCCGDAAMDVQAESIIRHEQHGSVIVNSCGPKAGMIPFTMTVVDSNPPDCKQTFNFPCEAFTFEEKVARALLATGCTNRNPDLSELGNGWDTVFSDEKIWGRLQDFCEVVQKGIGGASTQQRAMDFCCGVGETCMPTHCTTPTSWDCGEPRCPIMADTAFSGANGIETHIGIDKHNCQTMCQLHETCNSWTWAESTTMCSMYSDTVSTSTAVGSSGKHSGYKCAKTFNCVQGQGKQGSAYATYSYNTEAECAAKCFEDSGSRELGLSEKKPYSCVWGQGPSGQSLQYSLNNRDQCAQLCNSLTVCQGFDWTPISRSDSCRIYVTTSNARVDNAGSHNRQWCTKVHLPCVGFDFSENDGMSNSCRLYTTTSNARVGDEGNDDRMWCPEHTGGFLPEAEFDCQSGSVPFASGYFQSDETAEECARRCSTDHRCAGFDFHFESENGFNDPCRLMYYERDELVNTGSGGGANRKWCRRVTYSERQNNHCDDLPEEYCDDDKVCRWSDDEGSCTLEDSLWCRNGRISDDKSKWTRYYTSYTVSNSRGCWDKCKESPQCFGYEYKGSTCYLHDAFNVLDTYSRYVYQPGCEDGDTSFGCADQIPEDKDWKYCRRIASVDIEYLHSSAQQFWAPSRP